MPSMWMSESAILLLCWFCDVIILTLHVSRRNETSTEICTVLLDDITGIKHVQYRIACAC